MKGNEVKLDTIEPGQRWRYYDGYIDVTLEIVKNVSRSTNSCKIVKYVRGGYQVGSVNNWSFDYSGGNYEYLEGQDKPRD